MMRAQRAAVLAADETAVELYGGADGDGWTAQDLEDPVPAFGHGTGFKGGRLAARCVCARRERALAETPVPVAPPGREPTRVDVSPRAR